MDFMSVHVVCNLHYAGFPKFIRYL